VIRRHFSVFLLLTYSLLALVFLAGPADAVVRALRHVVYYLSHPWIDPPLAALEKTGTFGRNLARVVDLDRTYRDLEEKGLLEKLDRLRVETAEAENDRLTRLVGMTPLPRFSPLVARVWARETSGGFQSLVIRRGGRDGLRPADPVITLAGDREAVVGQVAEVFPGTARLTLLTDPSSAVSALVPRTGDQGAAEGAGPSSLHLNYLFADAEVRPGDEVVTAGLGNVFPRGVLLGIVESVDNAGPESFRRALVRPAARIGRLSEVVVLRRSDGGNAP
jgi:rod shape-determining protein MreC